MYFKRFGFKINWIYFKYLVAFYSKFEAKEFKSVIVTMQTNQPENATIE